MYYACTVHCKDSNSHACETEIESTPPTLKGARHRRAVWYVPVVSSAWAQAQNSRPATTLAFVR